MELKELKPKKALNKAFLKVKPNRAEIEGFKTNLIQILDRTNDTESEEFHKNLISDFLKKTYYDPNHFINTKGRNDLVIHNGNDANSSVGVIIEAKKPTNKTEMMTTKKLNVKAFQELVLYYLRERITQKNLEVKYLIATNINEWFVFDATLFDRLFAQNKTFVKQFNDFEGGRLADTKTDFFYKQIAEPFIDDIKTELEFTYFNIQDYQKTLRNTDKTDDSSLIALFKLLSPEHLLKLPFSNDSNSLDKRFYSELLHIIGLTETKDGGKKLIERNKEGERNSGSMLEDTIIQLDSLDKISRLDRPSQYGNTNDERLFNVGLELCITWINRILFLKLLEAQLIIYHRFDKLTGGKAYSFLNFDKIKNYDDLNSLFFQVLARKYDDRNQDVKKAFEKVPYLNSSLFEPTEMEQVTLFISNLKDDKTIPVISSTVLKNDQGKKRTGSLTTLEYLFEFLNAYDFASEGSSAIQEDDKSLINASVLGLIFEKINGYKDGSFFTPGFITMYMCRETIRKAVVQKFNEHCLNHDLQDYNITKIEDIYDLIPQKISRKKANEIVDSIKICDPAVGSGHFLVSALNEMIAVKNDLKILQDREGKSLHRYEVEVVNDELIVTDEEGELFEYNPSNKESQRIQETLFHEKQTIIENCLFGVDINPNSVKICRLRLWIELLKNAYYKNATELETLPNIDINIKCGNSLVSKYRLDEDLTDVFQKQKFSLATYRDAVQAYKDTKGKDTKAELLRFINEIKEQFKQSVSNRDPRRKQLSEYRGKRTLLDLNVDMFGNKSLDDAQLELQKRKFDKLIAALETEIADVTNAKIYHNSFEWRFEFPEVLNEKGDFVGFDVVIGNPPYISIGKLPDTNVLKSNFKTFTSSGDLYVLFMEKGFDILKKDGEISYIIPNKWMQAGYGKPMRNLLLQKQISEIIDFGDLQVFDGATTYPCIIGLKNNAPQSQFANCIVKTPDFGKSLSDYVLTQKVDFETDKLTDDTWILSKSEDQIILSKLKRNCISLSEYIGGEAHYGIKTGLTEAFIIDEEIKNRIVEEDEKSISILKPVLRGRDIKPYYAKSSEMWLIGTFPTLKLNIENYQGVKNHLLTFGQNRLEQSGNPNSRKKSSNQWFETQDNIGYWQEFEKPKIMYQVMQVKPCFIYDENGLYCNNSMWIIPKDDKALLGILNSKMGWWLISKYCTAIQNGYQLIWNYFGQILIPKFSPEAQTPFIEKVNQILALKKADAGADTSVLEAEIDAMVYQLYDLTAAEILIVEGK